MLKALLSIFLFTVTFQAQAFTKASALECEAVSQTVVDDQLKSEEIKLSKVFEDARTLQMAADIGDIHYFIQGDKKTHDYLLMITVGPDYTSGVTSALTWDLKNQMRITRVDGDNVYKLLCGK